MRKDKRDVLRELDWSKVYAEVPGAVEDGVDVAFMRIRRRRQHSRRMMRWVACAACLALFMGGVARTLRSGERAPDRVATLASEVIHLQGSSEVYASRADEYFHVASNCPQLEDEAVTLKLVTAVEFQKALCPACGANVVLDID